MKIVRQARGQKPWRETCRIKKEEIRMLGNLINMAAIAGGSLLGLFFGSRLQEKYRQACLKAGGLVLLFLGLQMGLKMNNSVLVLLSLTLGSLLGEMLDINSAMERLGQRVEGRLSKGGGGLSQAFIYATLLFCTGPMSIMGGIRSGLAGDHSILITKAVLDGIFAMVLTATMGIGVIGSAVTTGLYQGIFVLGAGLAEKYMTEVMVAEMTATGGLLILAMGLNMLEIKEFKAANMLPALLLAVILAGVWV